jgi:eukaryotic-like serine/threonine-protein kinase
MTRDERLVDLLMKAEDLRRQGRPVVAEELCRDCPELLPALQRLLQGIDGVEKLLGNPAGGNPAGRAAAPPRVRGYTIRGELGRGGMGVVYDAEQQALGRRVALKVLTAAPGESPERLARFQREVRAAARLHHTNIVPVFEVGQDDGVWFYAMQFIPGRSLSDLVDQLRHGRQPARDSGPTSPAGRRRSADPPTGSWTEASTPVSVSNPDGGPSRPEAPSGGALVLLSPDADPRAYFREVARAGQQVAEALACAHAHGVLHRDVKPANLLLDESGQVWVTDFGLAKTEEGDLTPSGAVVGTLRYVAPEQIRGQADARSDVYSLGLTLYELLTLRPAFEEEDRLHLLEQVVHREPPRPGALDRRIPRDLETIVLKAIAKDPARRYQTADDLADDLRRFLEDRPVRARPTPWFVRLYLWGRRNPALAALVLLAAGLTLAVAAVSTVSAFLLKEERDAARRTADDLEVERTNLAAQRQKALEAGAEARAERDRFNLLLYRSNLRLVRQLLDSDEGTARAAAELLEEHVPTRPGDPDLRDFAWRALWARLHQSAPTLPGVRSPYALAQATDGALVVLAVGGAVTRWDPVAGRPGAEQDFGRPRGARRAALSPDGAVLARGDVLGTAVRFFDTATGRELRAVRGPAPFLDAVFAPGGAFLLVLWADRRLRVYETATGREAGAAALRGALAYRDLALAPDGRTALMANQPRMGAVTAYDLRSGDAAELPVADNAVSAVAWSADGSHFASADDMGKVRLWGAARTPEGSAVPLVTCPVTRLAFSPDGRRLAAAAADGQVVVLDLKDRESRTRFKGHLKAAMALAFTRDGRSLLSADASGALKVWDLAAPADGGRAFDTSVNVQGLAYGPDGRWLAAVGDGLWLWDVRAGGPARVLAGGAPRDPAQPPAFACAAFAPDGGRLFSGGGDSVVRAWDPATGRSLWAAEEVPESFYPAEAAPGATASPRHKRCVGCLAVSPDGALVAAGFGFRFGLYAGNYRQVVRVYDAHTGRTLQTLAVGQSVRELRFLPGGGELLAGFGRTVRTWRNEAGTWKPAAAWTVEPMVTALAVSPDGGRVAVGLRGSVALWDPAAGREVGRFTAQGGSVTALAFTPDGRTLATASFSEPGVKCWDVATQSEVVGLRRGEARPLALAFAPAGDRLLAGGPDGIWEWPAPPLDRIDAARAAEAERVRAHDQAEQQRLAAPSAPPAAEGPPDRLDARPGRYRTATGWGLTLARQGNRLILNAPGFNPLPFAPVSATEFVSPATGARLRFVDDPAGRTQKLLIEQDGGSLEAVPVPGPGAGAAGPPATGGGAGLYRTLRPLARSGVRHRGGRGTDAKAVGLESLPLLATSPWPP